MEENNSDSIITWTNTANIPECASNFANAMDPDIDMVWLTLFEKFGKDIKAKIELTSGNNRHFKLIFETPQDKLAFVLRWS